MKTKEELNALTEHCKDLRNKLSELTEDELYQVVGGADNDIVWLFEKSFDAN